MSYTESHTITLTKPAQRQLRDKVIATNVDTLLVSVMTRSLHVRGWSLFRYSAGNDTDWLAQNDATDNDGYVYTVSLSLTFARDDGKTPDANEFAAILRSIYTKAVQPAYGKWTLATVDGEKYIPLEGTEDAAIASTSLVGYADLEVPEDFEGYFDHLYGLDAHIARVKAALEASIMSDYRNRYHVALIGPPGCGKSDLCQTLKRALGDDAVMEYDATATTGAGAIKDLAERDILPRVLIVEEIEKADPQALAFLLGVMDLRAEIRKTTARAKIERETKVFVIATVNNVPLFNNIASGALSSRFANKVHFKRPSREQLAMILEREVKRIAGDTRWIAPALDYAEEHAITDPRMVTALCLCGRDQLITGEYQQMLADTSEDAE